MRVDVGLLHFAVRCTTKPLPMRDSAVHGMPIRI